MNKYGLQFWKAKLDTTAGA